MYWLQFNACFHESRSQKFNVITGNAFSMPQCSLMSMGTPLFFSKLKFSYDEYSVGKVWTKIPQGSVLSPLLFLVYVNDIYMASDKLTFYLFADDTNLLYADKNPKSLETIQLWTI